MRTKYGFTPALFSCFSRPAHLARTAASQHRVEAAGAHAYCKCGQVRELTQNEAATRPVCQGKGWVPVRDARREAQRFGSFLPVLPLAA